MQYNAEPLLECCYYLFPYDHSLQEEVRLSIRSPKKYLLYMKNQWPFSQEGIQEPLSNLPWFALLSGLARRRLLFSWNNQLNTPWKLHHTDTKYRWAGIIKEGRWDTTFSLQSNKSEEYDLFINLAAQYLTPFDYVLCEFTPSCAPTTLTILKQETAVICKELAQDSGYGNLIIYHAEDFTNHQNKSHALIPALLTMFPSI